MNRHQKWALFVVVVTAAMVALTVHGMLTVPAGLSEVVV